MSFNWNQSHWWRNGHIENIGHNSLGHWLTNHTKNSTVYWHYKHILLIGYMKTQLFYSHKSEYVRKVYTLTSARGKTLSLSMFNESLFCLYWIHRELTTFKSAINMYLFPQSELTWQTHSLAWKLDTCDNVIGLFYTQHHESEKLRSVISINYYRRNNGEITSGGKM